MKVVGLTQVHVGSLNDAHLRACDRTMLKLTVISELEIVKGQTHKSILIQFSLATFPLLAFIG